MRLLNWSRQRERYDGLEFLVTIVLKIRLELPAVTSLKGKRRILKSLFARLRNRFNISISEIGDNDLHRSALIAAAIVSNDSAYGHSVLSKVADHIETNSEALVIERIMENY